MKLGAGEEQAKAKLLDLRIPCLRVQHPSAEVENDLFNTLIELHHHRSDGRVSY
jgi:hypothetical protein